MFHRTGSMLKAARTRDRHIDTESTLDTVSSCLVASLHPQTAEEMAVMANAGPPLRPAVQLEDGHAALHRNKHRADHRHGYCAQAES